MQNKYTKLIKSSFVYALGNVGSSLISFIMLPLYTGILSTTQYGTIDFFQTTVDLMFPLISLNITDGILRYALDKRYKKEQILTNCSFIVVLCVIVFLVLSPFLSFIEILQNYIFLFVIILLLRIVNETLKQFLRGIEKNFLYVLSDITYTFIFAGCNILFLVVFKTGIYGYFYSMAIGLLCSILILAISGKVYRYINWKYLDFGLMKMIILYSLPLIPNTVMWWIMNALNRYSLIYFVGLSANGIYAVANKFPSILTMLNSIFFKAWQVSAIQEYDSESKHKFYTNVFGVYSTFLILGVSGIILFIQLIVKILVSQDYSTAWIYVPFLLLSVLFSCFSSFIGTNYIASRETKGTLKTSVAGAAVNIIGNLTLIPLLGIKGAGISSAISFFVTFIYRLLDTRRMVVIDLDKIKFWGSLLIVTIQACINTFINLGNAIYILNSVLFLTLAFLNRDKLFMILDKLNIKRSKKAGGDSCAE